MDQSYGQQPPPATPPVPPPPTQGYGAAPPTYETPSYTQPGYAPQSYAPPRRGWMLGRMLRLLVMRFFGVLGRIGRVLRPHWLLAIVAVLLLSVIVIESGALAMPVIAGMFSNQGTQRAASIPPAPIIDTYIQAQREFNAGQIWNSFSEDFKTYMRDQGNSQTKFEDQIKQEHDMGQQYLKFDYVGGVNTSDGGSKFFYMVEIKSPNPQRDGVISYVFTVDTQGKIAGLEVGSSAH